MTHHRSQDCMESEVKQLDGPVLGAVDLTDIEAGSAVCPGRQGAS